MKIYWDDWKVESTFPFVRSNFHTQLVDVILVYLLRYNLCDAIFLPVIAWWGNSRYSSCHGCLSHIILILMLYYETDTFLPLNYAKTKLSWWNWNVRKSLTAGHILNTSYKWTFLDVRLFVIRKYDIFLTNSFGCCC